MAITDQLNSELEDISVAAGSSLADLATQIRQAIVALATLHETDKSTLEAEVTKVASDLATLTASLDANALADLQAIADRISADTDLQGDIATLQGLISDNQALIATLQGIDTTFQATVDALDVRTTAVESSLSSLQTSLTSLNTTVSGIQTTLNSHDGRISANEADIAAIKSDLAAVAVNATAAIKQGFDAFVGTSDMTVTIGGVVYDLRIGQSAV